MKSYRQIYQYDSRLGYKYMPNLSLTILGNREDNMRDYKIITDQNGFRNNQLNNLENIENLFIGCSFTAGDGIQNCERFTDKISQKTYNAALSGSDLIQQYLIAEDISKIIKPKRVFLSPYIGCIQRNLLKERKMEFLGIRKSWPKPYAEFKEDKLFLKNIPVPKPFLDFSDFKKDKKDKKISKFLNKFKNRIFRGKDFLNNLDKNYNSVEQYKICKYCIKHSKSYFKNSEFLLMPLPNWEFQKLSNLKLQKTVKNFYDSLANELNIKHVFLNDFLKSLRVK